MSAVRERAPTFPDLYKFVRDRMISVAMTTTNSQPMIGWSNSPSRLPSARRHLFSIRCPVHLVSLSTSCSQYFTPHISCLSIPQVVTLAIPGSRVYRGHTISLSFWRCSPQISLSFLIKCILCVKFVFVSYCEKCSQSLFMLQDLLDHLCAFVWNISIVPVFRELASANRPFTLVTGPFRSHPPWTRGSRCHLLPLLNPGVHGLVSTPAQLPPSDPSQWINSKVLLRLSFHCTFFLIAN